MKWFKNLNIRPKLILSFLAVAVLAGAVGGVGISNIRALDAASTEMYENMTVPLARQSRMAKEFQRIRVNTLKLLLATDPAKEDEYARQIATLQGDLTELSDELKGNLQNDALRARFAEFERERTAFVEARDRVIALARSGRDEEALEVFLTEAQGAAANTAVAIDDLIELKREQAREKETANDALARRATLVVSGIVGGAVVLALLLGVWISGIIGRPLGQLGDLADRVASGDLDVDIEQDTDDEIGQLAAANRRMVGAVKALVEEANRLARQASAGNLKVRGRADEFRGGYAEVIEGFNNTLEAVVVPLTEAKTVIGRVAEGDLTVRMTGRYDGDLAELKDALNHTVVSMEETLSQVSATASQVSAGSRQVAEASQSLSESATQQAASVQETSSAMVEIGEQTRSTAENAEQANDLAGRFRDASDRGTQEMESLVKAMAEIDQSSQDISAIIKVIDEIAFQTNLLALNAAVEAARAGRHGKGFAVVAEEVRNLAARSAKAAKETADLIEGAVAKAKTGSEMAHRTSSVLEEISSGSREVVGTMEEIATSAGQQASAVSQVNTALVQIDEATQQNTAGVEQSAAAAEELSGHAGQLQQMLQRFTLSHAGYGSAPAAPVPTVAAPARPRPSSGDGASYDPYDVAETVDPSEVIRLDDDDFGKY